MLPSLHNLTLRDQASTDGGQQGYSISYWTEQIEAGDGIDNVEWLNFPEWVRMSRDATIAWLRHGRTFRGKRIDFVHETFYNDKEIAIIAVQQQPWALESDYYHRRRVDKSTIPPTDLGDPWQFEWEVVVNAVMGDGRTLSHAGRPLQDNYRLVMLAVENAGHAVQYAGPTMIRKLNVQLAAVRQNGLALQHLENLIVDEIAVTSAAVSQNGQALEYAPYLLKTENKEVVGLAVQQNGMALRHAGEDMRADKDILLKAVRQNGLALQYSTNYDNTGDFEVVFAAVESNGQAIQWANANLKGTDLESRFLFMVSISKDEGLPRRSRAAPFNNLNLRDEYKADEATFVENIVKKYGDALKYAAPEMRNSRSFRVLAALESENPSRFFAVQVLRDLLKDVQIGLQDGNMAAMIASIKKGSYRLFLMPQDAKIADYTKSQLFALYFKAAERLEQKHNGASGTAEGDNEILYLSELVRLIIANPEYDVAVDIALEEMNEDFEKNPQDPSKRGPATEEPEEAVPGKRRKQISSLADFIGAEAYARLGLDTHVHWQ